MSKSKKKLTKFILNICLLIGFVAIIYCVYSIINLYKDNNSTKKMIEKIQLEVIEKFPVTSAKKDDNVTQTQESIDLTLDFEKLSKINNDTVAWIKVSGTNIDYPIVQTTNNDYYLNHSFDKTKNQNGWPFLNSDNAKDFSDHNTILFGHNTNGTTMFSQLKDIYNGKYGTSIDIYIYLENEVIQYQVFSIYLEEPTNVSSISKFITSDIISKSIEKSKIKFGIDVSDKDYILTLSTCNNVTDDRIIMQAKKVI